MTREERFQERAEELRTIADGLHVPEAAEQLQVLALQYEQLAVNAAKNPRTGRPY